MSPLRPLRMLSLAVLVTILGCPKKEEGEKPAPKPATTQAPAAGKTVKVGLVTDVGGRGDQSFNDSALRGLETWAAGKRFTPSGYADVSKEEYAKTIPADLANHQPPLAPLPVEPMVLQSKVQEDYEPNLQLLVDRGAQLVVGVGFMLEPAVRTASRQNPNAKFLLIDSPLLDESGKPRTVPTVRSVTFREEQGSFLVGALAGLVTKTDKVAFVGGMEVPLIKKFEAGFRAGVMATNPKAQVLVNYTGSFDNVQAGKQVGQDLAQKGADVIYQAAGSDGRGVIQAVKEARDAGKPVFVIGVDSDQSHVAPGAVLTSMLKHVDLAIYEAARDLVEGKFTGGTRVMGLAEGGVAYAPVTVDFPGKAEALQKVEALKQKVIAGEIQVPTSPAELANFKAAP